MSSEKSFEQETIIKDVSI